MPCYDKKWAAFTNIWLETRFYDGIHFSSKIFITLYIFHLKDYI